MAHPRLGSSRLVVVLAVAFLSGVMSPASALALPTTYDDAVRDYDTVLSVARLDSSVVAGRTPRAGAHAAPAGHSVRDSQVCVAAKVVPNEGI